MNMLAIDRSTDTQSVAVAKDGKVVGRVFAGLDARSAEWPLKIRAFLADNGLAVNDLDRILVGQGPGSFAGIRAALAFAQGLAVKDFVLVSKDELANAVPEHYAVVTPDGARIEQLLQGVFGHHYKGSLVPLAQRLVEVALADPSLPKTEPLPLYLQPAVRA